jgi:capsular polysaccharide transport system permease protein
MKDMDRMESHFELKQALSTQYNIYYALMLRDIRSRFFGHGLGYLIVLAWPLTHILVVVIIFTFTRRVAPVGDNLTLFAAAGLVPYITFNYMTRFMMVSAMMNRPLLAFPIVKILDLVLARALLEILSTCCVTALLVVVLTLVGINCMPLEPQVAAFALGASIVFGLGSGVINTIISMAFRPWYVCSILFFVVMYASSGILFDVEGVPEIAQYLLSFNPLVHLVLWMRSAYYPGYGASILDKAYPIYWGVVMLFIGLICERMFRGKLLQG